MPIADILTDLDAQVTKATTVMAGAALLIRGIGARIDAAVAAAVQNGATDAQLAPITAEAAALKTSADDLSAAISENTAAAKAPKA